MNKGEVLYKSQLAEEYGVSEKTVKRDIDELRAYLSETHLYELDLTLKYDKKLNAYYLVQVEREWFTNKEVLAISKILLESRAFKKDEIECLIEKLLLQVTQNDRRIVNRFIGSERANYIPPKHNKALLDIIWHLTDYLKNQKCISISYIRKDGSNRRHIVEPLAIIFSEFYFYLICNMKESKKEHPTIFRIDRIEELTGTGQKFRIQYKDRFSEGGFRNRDQFMYSGELRRVIFQYTGPSIESVLDKLPTAEIISNENGMYTVVAETYDDGIYMWILSQGDWIKLVDEEK